MNLRRTESIKKRDNMATSSEFARGGHTRNQYYGVISANILMLGFGAGCGWFSPALPLLLSSDTPLKSGPLSTEELAWAGSILSFGGITGCLLFGFLTTRIGTRLTLLIQIVPQLASWLFLTFGTCAIHISVSRFLTGVVGGAFQTAGILYVAEIADDHIRGKLGTSNQLSRNSGILLAYVLGMYINYIHVSMVGVAMAVLFMISFIFLPSTPQYLLKIGEVAKAKSALRFYKGYSKHHESRHFEEAFLRLQLISQQAKEEPRMSFKDLCEPQAIKGILIGLVLTFLCQSCGTYIFITYASTIFERSGTSFSAEWSTIVLGVVQLIGTLLTARFVETQGRRPLLIISMAGCTVGLLAMSIYLYLVSLEFDMSLFAWVPVTSLAFVTLISSIGIVPVTIICLVESLPTEVRSFGLTIGSTAMSLYAFGLVITFPMLMEIIELHGCMLMLAVTCLFGLVFVIFVVEETKGKALDVLKHEKGQSYGART